MGNTDRRKPPLTLKLNTPSYALVCATYKQSSKAEWANRCCFTGYKHSFSLSCTRNNKVGIMLPRLSCLSHDCETVCSKGRDILFMPFAHSENNNLLLPLVLLRLENDA